MQAEEIGNTNMRGDDSTNIQKPPKPMNNSGNSERARSNRSSLIITHEDGTTEENDCVVTSLGFSHVDSSGLTIVEIGQKNKARSVSIDDTRMSSPEIVTVDVHRDPDYIATHLPSVTRDHSPLLEIETLPNSPSPCMDKMSSLSISPPPQSPSISLSPSPRSSFTGGSASPHSWAVEASRPLDYPAQCADSVDSWGGQTVGGGQTEQIMVEGAVKVEEDKRANTDRLTSEKQQSKSPDDDWEMVRFAETEKEKIEEKKKSFSTKVFKIPIQLEGEERNLSQTLGKKSQKSSNENNQIEMQDSDKEIRLGNTWNANNATRMQMGVDNGPAFGTPAVNKFGSPKPVRIVPIEIEINNDKVTTTKEREKQSVETDQKITDNKVVDTKSEHVAHKRVIPIKPASGNGMSRNSTSSMDGIRSSDIIGNGKKPADRVTVPIKIEMNDDTSNIKVDINCETKSKEMTKKHFARQTSDLSTPQQTMTHNGQKEKAQAKINYREKGVGDTHLANNPPNTRKVPIRIEQPENADICKKENVNKSDFGKQEKSPKSELKSMEYTGPVQNDCTKPDSPSKTQPDSANFSTIFATKPPQGKRNVQIQRDASKEEVDKKSTSQQERKNVGQPNEVKSEVDFNQIQTQLEDAKQKLEVQMKQMRTGSTAGRKVEPRSRSVGSDFKNLGARPKNSNPRYAFRRERSMEDIDKDIETIWKELQELDKLPRSEDRMSENIKVERNTPERKQSTPLPLSEQELVIPSWRTKTPPVNRKVSIPISVQKSVYKSTSPQQRPTLSSSPRTIWDTPDDRPSSAISQNQRFPATTNHFSFIPKADTKPGAITPTRVNISTRPSRSPTRAKGPIKEDPVLLRDDNKFAHDRSQSMPRENSAWPECYNSFQKIQGQTATGVKHKESTPLKSCLKSESRSNSLARTSKIRSKSPSSSESPAKQNVNFKHETILKKFHTENETSTEEQPYEFIDVRSSQVSDEPQKVKLPPVQTKLYDNKNMRVVPIVRDVRKEKNKSENTFTTKTKHEPTTSARTVPIQIKREKEINLNPFLSDGDSPVELVNKKAQQSHISEVQTNDTQAPLATEDACYACDACTQTVEKDKKDVM